MTFGKTIITIQPTTMEKFAPIRLVTTISRFSWTKTQSIMYSPRENFIPPAEPKHFTKNRDRITLLTFLARLLTRHHGPVPVPPVYALVLLPLPHTRPGGLLVTRGGGRARPVAGVVAAVTGGRGRRRLLGRRVAREVGAETTPVGKRTADNVGGLFRQPGLGLQIPKSWVVGNSKG